MATKFFEEFQKQSKNEFPMLKFHSATYLIGKKELNISFIISKLEIPHFGEDKIGKVKSIVENMFPGVNVTVEYVRTYADERLVRNKIYEFFNKFDQITFRRMTEKNLSVEISDNFIYIKFEFNNALYTLMKSANYLEQIKDYLDLNFNQDIEAEMFETDEDIALEPQNDAADRIYIDTVASGDSTIRLVDVNIGNKLYSQGRVAGINQLPGYISDAKKPAENVVLCGKVSNLTSKMYKNKKYDPDDKSSGPPEKPLISFILDDTTAKIECVCFPKEEDKAKIEAMQDKQQVIAAGRLAVSTYNNSINYTINALFEAEIDFSSVKLATFKPAPKAYSLIYPESYKEIAQKTLFEEDLAAVPSYLKGKTFVVMDFEATDKSPSTAEPIELAAAKMVNGKITETFQSLLKPSVAIPPMITELTSITDEMVETAPKFEDILPDFYKFTRDSILVGHNLAGYDYPLLTKYADKAGYLFDNDLDDTLVLSTKYLPELKNHKLVTITKSFDISHANAHRAMADVMATAELLKIIAKRIG